MLGLDAISSTGRSAEAACPNTARLASEVAYTECGIERRELSQRGSRHPARASMAYLARRPTALTNGELAEVFGASRAQCSELDAAIRRVVSERSAGSRAVEAYGGRVAC
jgi:hypothetical protein